jgi:hypothetical protein
MPRKKTVLLGQMANKARRQPGVAQKFVYEADKKVSAGNKHILRRMNASRMLDQVHNLTRVVEHLNKAIRFLDHTRETDEALIDSGLLINSEDVRRTIYEEEKSIRTLVIVRDALQRDRKARLREVVSLEQKLEREGRRQQREAHKKKKEEKTSKKAAERRLEPNEENGAPTLLLDPTLLGEATKALTLDPGSAFNSGKQAKTSGKSKKKHTTP